MVWAALFLLLLRCCFFLSFDVEGRRLPEKPS